MHAWLNRFIAIAIWSKKENRLECPKSNKNVERFKNWTIAISKAFGKWKNKFRLNFVWCKDWNIASPRNHKKLDSWLYIKKGKKITNTYQVSDSKNMQI